MSPNQFALHCTQRPIVIGKLYAHVPLSGYGTTRSPQFNIRTERLQQAHREIEEHLIPALRMQPGFSGSLLFANPQQGKVLAVSLWEDEQQMHATDEASHWFRVFGAEAFEGTVKDVETYQVYRARLDHPLP